MKRALITGITGQDGSYLAELLLAKGYEVYGLVRRQSSFAGVSRISHLLGKVTLVTGDLLDIPSLVNCFDISRPDEVYHLAAQSHVGESFVQPVATMHYNAIGTLNMLETCPKHVKFYNASSSEMFGLASSEVKLDECSDFRPQSPYAISKLAAHELTANYRQSYDMFACSGILFNHESPRRGEEFVTRKISRAAARIKLGLQDKLELGNVTAQRDWGYAPDYVQAMWLMLQQSQPDDYVIATGESYSVWDFVTAAFDCVGLDPRKYVIISQQNYRPTDVQYLRGDYSKALETFGWQPTINFRELVQIMVEADVKKNQTGDV